MADYVTKKYLDEALMKLFRYIKKSNEEMRGDFHRMDQKYDHLTTTLDDYLKRIDDIEANDAGRDVQLARHEGWFDQLATETGTKLVH